MKLLVAVDGSSASHAALGAIKIQPWPADCQIRVLSVAEPVYPPPPPAPGAPDAVYPYPSPGMPSMSQQMLEQARQVAESAANELRSLGCAVQAIAVAGDPRETIVDQAAEWGADRIVVGSHGRTGLKRLLLGSVAESVVRHAPCSVEVARSRS